MTADRLSEDSLIARHFAPLAGPGGLHLQDDAALLTPPAGCDLILTKDALVAGVHFFADDPPADIARKALRVNLSDLAAKGAEPLGFLIALALPPAWRDDWLADFAKGLKADIEVYRFALLGGDTVFTPGPLMVSVTAIGACARGRMVRRTGVEPGDDLFVTGTIGDAALGLRVRQGLLALPDAAHRAHLRDRYLVPQPRSALAAALQRLAHAGMDVSDGFVGDLTKMLRVSGCGATIDLDALPLSAAARVAISADDALFETAATGGDDYELLVAAPPAARAALVTAASEAGIALTLVGAAHAGPVVFRRGGASVTYATPSFSHF